MNVFGGFDGMSCGQIALEKANIPVDLYYASEINEHAMKVTNANYPNTIQMGSITEWREWDIDWSTIDLFLGGSPCQGFSAAGKQGGTKCVYNGEEVVVSDRETYLDMEAKGAEFLSQSYLFWEWVLLLDHVKLANPHVKFMLENVKMSKNNMDMITNALGVKPVFINSALLTAQMRQRWYWANWDIPQPEDKGILLKDILECDFVDREKSHCLDANYFKGGNLKSYFEKNRRQLVFQNPAAMVGRKIDENGKRNDNLDIKPVQCLEVHEYGKARCLSTVSKDTLVSNAPKGRYPLNSAKDKNPEISGDYLHFDPTGKGHRSECNRVNLPESKHKSLSGTSGGNKHGVVVDTQEYTYRKLTPIECERLQTVPDNYTNHVSNTQRYKMLGNGWTVDVIAHIFKQAFKSYRDL